MKTYLSIKHSLTAQLHAGADCGFAASALRFNDTHPSIAWLKFAALAEGARLATRELWR